MSRKIIHTVVLAALAGFSALALAEDPPAMVGRISSVQGQVTLVGDGEPMGASLNFPVTASNHINTASGARTEFRVGSTAVRLDGDSDLEIVAMDDDLLRLRLNYGSVSIRVRSPELLRDFELSTPHARITMIEPGVLRVDVDRTPDTSQISVLGGSARVDGAGSSVVVNNGRQVEVGAEDVRTSVARRDGFDVWAEDRDRLDSATTTTRYVSNGMTGYEELDRNGSWTESVEYGPLWTPRNVAMDWAPYRDGRWVFLAPWGWTWVDNAPWGYAPSHYGRWVMVNRRWCWAPGRPAGRPVWAPALVGWVGGHGGGHHSGPGLGWYPLSPRDRFVPGYRVSSDYERRVTWTHNGKPFKPRNDWNGQREGLTVLPREHFEGRRHVVVNRGASFIPQSNFVRNVTVVTPPQPPARPLTTNRGGDRDRDGIPDRFDRNDGRNDSRNDRNDRADRNDRNERGDRNDRNDRNDRPGRVITAPAAPIQVPAQPPRGQISTLAPNQFGRPDTPPQTINPNDVHVDVRPRFNPQQQLPRDRFDRGGDDNQRRFRPHDEQRQQPPQIQVQPPQQHVQQPPQIQAQPQIQQPPRQFTPPVQQAPAQPPRQIAPPPQAQPPAQRDNRPEPSDRRRDDNNRDRRQQNQQ